MNEWIILAVETIRNLGWIGPILFTLLYVATTVALLPGAALTLIAGFLYGPVYGLALASPASVIAATAAFALSRSVFRHRIERRIQKHPFLHNMNLAVERSGFKLMMLLRLSPLIPFVFLNYSLGLTRVRLRDYVLASIIGMFPATAMYAYIGSVGYSIAQLLSGQREVSTGESIMYWAGLVATVAIAVFLTRMARQALEAITEESDGEADPPVAGDDVGLSRM